MLCRAQALVGTVAHSALMDLIFSLGHKKEMGEAFEWDCVQGNTRGAPNSRHGLPGLTECASRNKQITVTFPREGYLSEGF